MRAACWLLLAALVLPLSQASTVEDNTDHEVAYQYDAGGHHDAPDACSQASLEWNFTVGGTTWGMLVPPDDLADTYALVVPAAAVGTRVTVRLSEAAGTPDADLQVFAPDCSDIFDALNLPSPFPTPPAPTSNEQGKTPENLATGWSCRAAGWTFKANQLQAAPGSIYVAWSDGTMETVAASKYSGGVAFYNTTSHLGTLPRNAWINVPASYSGHFLLDSGPCNAADGGAVYGDAPSQGDDLVSFTPIRSGSHVVRVTLAARPNLTPPPNSVPVTCHYCLGPGPAEALQKVDYFLKG